MRARAQRWVVLVGAVSLVAGLLPGLAAAQEDPDGEVTYTFDGFDALEPDEASSATIITRVDDAGDLDPVAPLRLVLTLSGEGEPLSGVTVGVRAGDDDLAEVTTDDQGRLFVPPAAAPAWTLEDSDLATGDGEEVALELTLPDGDFAVQAQLVGTGESDVAGGVRRLFGDGRVDTAVAVSADTFPDGADTAFVATGDDFPDALTGGPAADRVDAPILLTGGDFLPPATAAELDRLDVGEIIVLGGGAAVDAGVEAELAAYGDVRRYAGGDRFATAAFIATTAYEPGPDVAYVATAGAPWDALSGGAAAAATDGPVLLAYGDLLPEVTIDALRTLAPAEIRLLGGTEAVSEDVLGQLATLTEGPVTRLSGTTRFDTSAAISAATFTASGTDTAYVATGEEFADALTGVPGAGAADAPVLLVGQGLLPDVVADELTRLGSEGGLDLVVLGGPAAVGDQVVQALADYAVEGADPDLDQVTSIGDPGQERFRVGPDPEEPVEQIRAFWVDAFNPGIGSPEEVQTLVGDAVAANANTLIVQVGRRFDCFCNDAVYPRTSANIDPLPYDPLAELLEVAHAEGIEVHAWINATTLWNEAEAPPQPDHAFNLHGPDAEGRDRWLAQRVDGEEIIGTNAYIDPAHPDAVDYQVEAIASVVANYDIDGVNLDYIRYPDFQVDDATFESSWGYSEISLERFAATTGRDDVPEPDDDEFSQWRRDQVTNLVERIYLGVHQVDPQVKLSVDATTYAFGPQEYGGWEQTRPYTEVMQDWEGWMEAGIIDLLAPMNYKRNWMDDQAEMFSQWTTFIADSQYDRQAINGPALYLNDIDDSIAQLRETFEPSAAGNELVGWAGYSYANVSLDAAEEEDPVVQDAEREALIEALTLDDPEGDEPVFAGPATIPDMPWKGVEAHIAGAVDSDDLELVDGAPVELRQGDALLGSAVVDGSGAFGFVDVSPGDYQVVLYDQDAVIGQADVTAVAGQVATIVLTPPAE